ncbi:MAG: 16S rRNA processing protein RimM [Alcanivoracaceae bacterium]|nr:16S rRNA processing protein RimM [Alcanivoracaceae bacterium]
MNKDSRILIGKVSGCFGVKGWLKIFSYSDPRENITTYKSWIVGNKHFDSVESKKNGKLIVAKLKGVEDKETAQTLIGQKVEIEKQQLSQLNLNQFYWHDLIGLEVTNTEGINFGKIKSMLDTGAHDVVIINGTRERLIPYIIDEPDGTTIIKIDLEKKTMLVDWHEDD